MKKRIVVFILIVMVIVGGMFYFQWRNEPIHFLNSLIKNVENGNMNGVELSNEEISSIRKMFAFSEERKLSKPNISFNKIHTDGNEEQILAAFEIFQYNNNNQIENIYAGHLSFTVEKKSLFAWRVLEVETINNMKKQF